jgi:hypothetical protein
LFPALFHTNLLFCPCLYAVPGIRILAAFAIANKSRWRVQG